MGTGEKTALIILVAVALFSFLWSLKNAYIAMTVPVPAAGGTYVEGLLGQPTYLNPLLAHQETDLALVRLVYSGLYKYDHNGQLVPDLAAAMPEISEDQKQYIVKLKNNVKWHNDKLFTADDVIFTFQILKDQAYKSPLRPLWLSTNLEKINDFEVRFSTKDISGPFIYNLTLPILSKFVWDKVEPQNFLLSKNNLEAIGTGPYAIKEITKLPSGKIKSISLESFSNYFEGKPKIDTIVIKFYDNEQDILNAFHSREIQGFGYDSLANNLYLEKQQKDARLLQITLPQYQLVLFNLNQPILADVKVRQALSEAVNKQQIIDEVFKDEATLPAAYPWVFDNQNSFGQAQGQSANVEEAKKILDDNGWNLDPQTGVRQKKNQPFAISISTNDFPLNSRAAELLANQWRNLGLKVDLNILPTKQLTEERIKPRNFDVLLLAQKFSADPDPFPFWHSSQIKDPGMNLTGFGNPDADRLIIEARTTTDRQVRQKKYEQFNQLVNQYFPVIFLDQSIFVYAIDDTINGVNLSRLYEPNQRFYDVTNWYIMKKRIFK